MPTGFIKRDTTEQLSEEEIRRAEEELKKRRRYMPLQFLKPTRGRRPIDFKKGEGGGSGAPDYNPEALAFYWRVINDGGKFENGDYVNAQFNQFNGHETFALFPAGYNQGVVYAAMPNDGLADGTASRNSIANRTNKEQTLEEFGIDTHRIDYEGGLEVGEGLNEDSRVNSVPYSEPTSIYQGVANSGVTAEIYSWENGFTNCINFGDNSVLRYFYSISVPNSDDWVFSVYIEMDDGTIPIIGTDTTSGDFTLILGGILTGASTIDHVIGNIYRIWKTSNVSSGTCGIIKYTGQSGKDFRVVGWQLESGTYPTTYIGTSGSTVTRAADSLTGFGNVDCLPSDEGSLRVSMAALANDLSLRMISINNGTSAVRAMIRYFISTNTISARMDSGGVQASMTATVTDVTEEHDIIFTWKLNEFIMYIDGVKVDEDLAGTPPVAGTFNNMNFDDGVGGNPFYGRWKHVIVYNKALTQAEIDEFQNFTIETNWNL